MRLLPRRRFLAAFAPLALTGADEKKPAGPTNEWRRYPDPATEFEVLRLTDPEHAALLPAYYSRALSRNGAFLIFSSSRDGAPQVYRMDLKNGELKPTTQMTALDPATPALLAGDRQFGCVDGNTVKIASIGGGRARDLYKLPEGWRRGAGFSISADGTQALLPETSGEATRLRLISVARGAASTVLQINGAIEHPQANPRRRVILYRQGDESLWLVNFDGQQNRRLRLAEGRIGPAQWSPDGRTILYLLAPAETGRLVELREFAIDSNQDKTVAKTSQFAHFGINGNASVFIGASRNAASPHMLLLLRVTRRELTVCEHRASDLGLVAPRFSADSQSIYFQSDRHGKPAIYRIRVEKFVEKTEEET